MNLSFPVVVLIAVVSLPLYGVAQEASAQRPEAAATVTFHAQPYCGLYSLYAAALKEDKPFDFASVLKPQYIGCPKGSTIAELSLAATDHGLSATSVDHLSAASLRDIRHPVILYVKTDPTSQVYNHYVAYLGYRDGRYLVLDAGEPLKALSDGELLPVWSGMGLMISKSQASIVPVQGRYAIQLAAWGVGIGLLVLGWRKATPAVVSRWTIRLVLAVVLLRSGLAKLQNPYAFLIAIYRYEITGPGLSRAIAILLPALEMTLGVCLLAGILLRGAFVLTSLISLVFIGVITSVLARGLPIPCGCFGTTSEDQVSQATLWRAAALLLSAIIAYLLLRCMTSRAGKPQPIRP